MQKVVKQRNHFSKLSFEARKRVLFLLFDGAEPEAVRSDPTVRKNCEERGVVLSDKACHAIRRTKEYADYEASFLETARRTDGARWAAEILRTAGGLQDIADVTQLALLEQIREMTENADADPGLLLKLAGAVGKIKDGANAERVRRLQKQLEQRETELRKKKQALAELRKVLAEKDAQIEKLKVAAGTVDGAEVSREMDRQFGLT